jgi:hypothetical protein
VRILVAGGVMLAVAGTASLAQEESCVSALESRAKAGEAVLARIPRLDAGCSELKEKLDAFVAAEAALKKTDRSVRKACPAGEFVRGGLDRSARVQLVLEATRKRLADCPEPAKK